MRIALFITCLTDSFFPRSGIAVVKVLEHLGHEVEFPERQTCCGQPMFNTGLHDEAADLAARLAAVFEDADAVVTPSGSCCAMIREHFPSLIGERGVSLASRTYEFVEFLADVEHLDLRARDARWEGVVAVHDSCHLRGMGLAGRAATLLTQIEGVRCVEIADEGACCGFGGTFAVKYPDVSGVMGRSKVEAIDATGATHAVVSDGGCALSIAGACHRAGRTTAVTSVAEIVAESLGLLPHAGADA